MRRGPHRLRRHGRRRSSTKSSTRRTGSPTIATTSPPTTPTATRSEMSTLALSPVAAAARLAGRRGRVLLHSARDDDGLGQWSFAAADPIATLIARGRSLVRLDDQGRPAKRFTADPFDAAEEFLAEHGCKLEPRADGPPDAR